MALLSLRFISSPFKERCSGWTIWARNRGLERKERGIPAAQGNSCGFGMRGQKSRSGPGVRKGFEGGQMPLYRRIPKLREVCMWGCQNVPMSLEDITAGFQEGDEESLETLEEKGLIKPSGRERTLPLKVWDSSVISVAQKDLGSSYFSLATCSRCLFCFVISPSTLSSDFVCCDESAREKIEAAGCSLTVLPGRKKWVKPSFAKNLASAEEYFAKKRAAAAASEPTAA
ncbi:hypothetical protein SADUNF_Sadunf10G0091800 [Salix dunnii]|uniref:Ribosomal protein L18e/L15P domain-containing protein n=1 Tax=Salix dunnii TaxID=1413687 RepID=A0A835MPF7_9ROSI|nr:hypothetical protein SADUNF_Sadunf10G0091800 [Salix dunnii]